MNNYKGFTLIELLISMGILTFVIMVSSVLFDRAIQNTPIFKQIIEKNASDVSNMEGAILMIKDVYRYYKEPIKKVEDKPKIYEKIDGDYGKGSPLEIDIEGGFTVKKPKGSGTINISKVKGYFISIPKNNSKELKYNDKEISNEDEFTFVGIGYSEDPTSNVKDIYLDADKRFYYLPMDDTPAKLKKIDMNYEIDNLNFNQIKAFRARFLKSPVNNSDRIFSVYTDSVDEYFENCNLTTSLFEYEGESYDKNDYYKNQNREGKVSYNIDYSYSLDKQGYLDAIDRSYAANGVTFNKNGHIGKEVFTFSNSNKSKQNIVHLLGVPYIENITSYYDSNLLMAKSKSSPNIYYSLSDLDNKDKTNYGNLLTKANKDIYNFNWDKNDSRNFISLSSNKVSAIELPLGFFKNTVLKSQEEKKVKNCPNLTKPYGNSIYYDMAENSIKLKGIENATWIFKYNAHNYNQIFNNVQDNGNYPYVILSYNYNTKTGNKIDGKINRAFVVYVDNFGEVKMSSIDEKGENINQRLGFNMGNTKLYSDGEYKFDRLTKDSNINDKRDDRENFNILSVVKNRSDIDIYILIRGEENNTISTQMQKLVSINMGILSKDMDFYFGSQLEFVRDDENNLINLVDSTKQAVNEISDIISYSENLSLDNLTKVMNYLYRKYLTENERKNGGFDNHFMKLIK